MVSAMRFLALSTSSTFTVTMSPGFTTSRGSFTKVFDRAEMCTRPSWCTPTSTKAPKAATLVTTPSSRMPARRSLIVSTPSWKVAVLKEGRGSRPGFSSSPRMSLIVGTPNLSSVKRSGWRDLIIGRLPISTWMSLFVASRMRRTTG